MPPILAIYGTRYELYPYGLLQFTDRLSLLYILGLILGRSTVPDTEDQAGLLRSPVTRSRATACGMCGLRRWLVFVIPRKAGEVRGCASVKLSEYTVM